MPAGRWVKGPKYQVRAHITHGGTRDCLTSNTASRQPGSNCLLIGETHHQRRLVSCAQPLKDSSRDGAHHGDHECQLHCKGWGIGGDLYGHCDYFHGASGPKQGTPTKGPIIEDIMDLLWWINLWPPLGRRVSQWPPLGRKIGMPLGRNHNQNLIISF